jgi:nitroreductase
MVRNLILKNRSYRRFDEALPVETETLRELIDCARLSPSAANMQPLRYIVVNDPENRMKVFPHLAWAGYLRDWPGPGEGERPPAYIVILLDTEITAKAGCDHGIAAQSILLGAVERGLGGCIIGSIRRDELRQALYIPQRFEILLVIALGRPVETVVLETVGADGDIKYWRSADGVHHVPKRPLGSVIIGPWGNARAGQERG